MMLWAEGVLAGLLSLAAFKSCSRLGRIPFLFYYLGYLVTTAIGALIIYATRTEAILQVFIFSGMDIGALPARLPDAYLHLLFLPFIVVSTTLLCLRAIFSEKPQGRLAAPQAAQDHPGVILALLAMCICYGLFCVIRVGMFPIGMFTAGTQNIILLRYSMNSALGGTYLSITAVVLPTLAVAFLVLFLRDRKRTYLYALLVAVFADFYFLSATFSKGGFISLLFYLIGGWAAVARLRPRIIAGAAFAAFGLFSFMTFQSSGSGTPMLLVALLAVRDIIFRLAVAFPFFVLLFPGVLPPPGPDVGLMFFNIGPSYPLITTVNDYMYPAVGIAQGSVTAPSHVMSYAEAGWGWATATLILTAATIFWTGRAAHNIKSSMGVAVFVATCVSLYFTTQGGFFSTFQVYYGCLWAWLTYCAYHLLVWFNRITSGTAP